MLRCVARKSSSFTRATGKFSSYSNFTFEGHYLEFPAQQLAIVRTVRRQLQTSLHHK